MLTGAASHRPFVSPGARSALPAGSMHGNATAERPRWNGSNLAGCQLTWRLLADGLKHSTGLSANTLVRLLPRQLKLAWTMHQHAIWTSCPDGIRPGLGPMLRYAALDCTRTIQARPRGYLTPSPSRIMPDVRPDAGSPDALPGGIIGDELRPVSRLCILPVDSPGSGCLRVNVTHAIMVLAGSSRAQHLGSAPARYWKTSLPGGSSAALVCTSTLPWRGLARAALAQHGEHTPALGTSCVRAAPYTGAHIERADRLGAVRLTQGSAG
jgi:hypothetical protein